MQLDTTEMRDNKQTPPLNLKRTPETLGTSLVSVTHTSCSFLARLDTLRLLQLDLLEILIHMKKT